MRTILITGATSGIGLECARQLAVQSSHLVLVGRNPDKLSYAKAQVTARGVGRVDTILCDFESLASVHALADEVLAHYDRLEVLINNAGTVYARRTETADGHEATFAVNHLGGYLLTQRLKDLLIASAPSRIVITASNGHYAGSMDFDDIHYRRGYSILKAYSRSKLANVLYARSLGRELAGTGVTVNALHPGLVSSNIWDGAPWYSQPVFAVLKRFTMITPEEGGRRLSFVAGDPSLDGITGQYFEDNRVAQPSQLALDDTVAERLRVVSDRLVGLDRGANASQTHESAVPRRSR
jgi:retinol dehydrogenase 14